MSTANSPSAGLHVSRSSAVVVQRVPAAAVEGFLEWQRQTCRVAEDFAGYCGTDLFPPTEPSEEWVALVHFEDDEALNRWLESPERARRVEALRSMVGDFELKTLSGGFGAWFVRGERSADEAPPSWKMVLTVLLGLFPTVMLLTIFVGPLTAPLGLSASMLIGNALSVSILQWAVMPLLTKWLDPWLRTRVPTEPKAWRYATAGILLVLGGLTFLFRQVTG